MSISDIGTMLSQQYMLSVLRDKVDNSSRQSSSGKKTDTIAGFGDYNASNSISARNTSNLIDSYTANLKNTKLRLTTTDAALTSITTTARDLLSQLQSQLQSTTPKASILSDNAATALQTITDKLNTSIDGRYVFSGQNFDSQAVDNMSGLVSNMGTLVTAAMADPTTTTAGFQASTQTLTGTALGVSTAAINGGTVTVKGDNSTNITTNLNADNPGFSDIMRGMAIVANLPQPTTAAEQANYWSLVNSAINLLQNGATAVDNTQAALGNQSKMVDQLTTEHTTTQATLQVYMGDVEDVDMAQAATTFSNLQTQLQTSYTLISSMKDMSLVKYL